MTTLRNFGEDLAFIRDHVETIVLSGSGSQQVIVVPAWQGRTMTSTARGEGGFSYGWVNYDRIASGKIEAQINLFGGEDRFWISPEGSQYSFFFDPGVEMELKNWRTPPELDIQPFDVIDQQECFVTLQKNIRIRNFSAQEFEMRVNRMVQINTDKETAEYLGMEIPHGVSAVCHESHNQITNTGSFDWVASKGLPAVWILCMNKPSDSATILVPFQKGSVAERGEIVTSDYFRPLDTRRLQICQKFGLIYFLGDGKYRSKLGVSRQRAVEFLGAWDAEHRCLTIVQFNLPDDVSVGYTNNLWDRVENPFGGDVINSYNDGPDELGGMMGPFYELETLSPALPLSTGSSFTHIHRTIHLEGDRKGLDQVVREIFGVNLETVEQIF